MPPRNYIFSDWLFAVVKLIRDQLRDLWVYGHIIGFISKARAEQILQSCTPGTFMFRISDSMFGKTPDEHKDAGISIVLMKDFVQFTHIEPFTYKKLSDKSIAVRVNELDGCVYLYPKYEKAEVFGTSCMQINSKHIIDDSGVVIFEIHLYFVSGNGYTPFVTALKQDCKPEAQSNPNTPQSNCKFPNTLDSFECYNR